VEEALERTLEARTQFMTDVSHELRTPLTVIRGNVEDGMQLDTDSQREILEEIASEAERRSRMVEDLLFLAGSDSESLPLNLETVPALQIDGRDRERELARNWKKPTSSGEKRVPANRGCKAIPKQQSLWSAGKHSISCSPHPRPDGGATASRFASQLHTGRARACLMKHV
jgi:signal transduction histidine kinase